MWRPAEDQFEKQGSFGNGAAMRVSPIGLLFLEMEIEGLNKVVEFVTKASILTHTHPRGIAGALFQAIAIRNTIKCRIISVDLKAGSNTDQYWESIISRIEEDLNSIKSKRVIKVVQLNM